MSYDYTYGLGLGKPIATDTFRITSWVGPRKQFNTSGGQKSSTLHHGVDIGVPNETPLLSPMDGVVVHVVNKNDGTKKRNQRGYGNQVVIRRGDGVLVQMSHLHSANVKVGDVVKQGQTVGLTGNSGSSTGPHLDYIVIKNGMAVRPDGTAYRAYNKPWLHGNVKATAPVEVSIPVGGFLAPTTTTPTAELKLEVPKLSDVASLTAPKTDIFTELAQADAVAEKQLGVLSPKTFTPQATDQFFTPKIVQAALITEPKQTVWRTGNGF